VQLSETLLPGSLSKLFGVITAALCMIRQKLKLRKVTKVGMTFRHQCGIWPETRKSGASARGKSEEAIVEILEKGLATVAKKAIWASINNFG
jgi:hypothetical protein